MASSSHASESSNVLKILVASDMHLGYGEKDPIRGEDSFNTFAEVFQIALEQQVDMILLAGDLFHDNKPSRKALQRAMEVMRDYCLGDRPVTIDVVSDQNSNFHSKYGTVNFEDPNYNVQMPVFSIHGNHDDPAGDGGLAALDLLSTANLINYFGRAENFEKISLSPVLIQKGQTKLALYGLGHVRDERLNRCFERKEVKLARPVENRDDWFSLLALHQNRLPRGAGMQAKGYIKEQHLPSCIDLVVWGHEHECLIGGGMSALPESVENEFVVLQPGSTVATALVEGEARPKHVALLSICRDAWQMSPIPLTTVRPFAIREVALRDHEEDYDLKREEGLMDFLAEQVEAMIEELQQRRQAAPHTALAEKLAKFPLVRLKVDYGGFTTCNPQRFGQRFVDRVANPSDIVLFQKTKVKRREEKAAQEAAKRQGKASGSALPPMPDTEEDPASQIQDLVADFLQGGKESLRLLPQQDMNAAVFLEFVAKDNKNAIRNQVEASLKRSQTYLAKESASALDASTDRKLKQDTIEQQLEIFHQRSAASYRASSANPVPSSGHVSSGWSSMGAGEGGARGVGGGGGGLEGGADESGADGAGSVNRHRGGDLRRFGGGVSAATDVDPWMDDAGMSRAVGGGDDGRVGCGGERYAYQSLRASPPSRAPAPASAQAWSLGQRMPIEHLAVPSSINDNHSALFADAAYPSATADLIAATSPLAAADPFADTNPLANTNPFAAANMVGPGLSGEGHAAAMGPHYQPSPVTPDRALARAEAAVMSATFSSGRCGTAAARTNAGGSGDNTRGHVSGVSPGPSQGAQPTTGPLSVNSATNRLPQAQPAPKRARAVSAAMAGAASSTTLGGPGVAQGAAAASRPAPPAKRPAFHDDLRDDATSDEHESEELPPFAMPASAAGSAAGSTALSFASRRRAR